MKIPHNPTIKAKRAVTVTATTAVIASAPNLSLDTLAHAQTIEDHSLPKSAIKAFHVKCSNARLGMVRYDTRTEPTKICVSVQDGSRAQGCVTVTQQQAPGHVGVLGGWICAS